MIVIHILRAVVKMPLGKVVIMILMFVGRVGLISFLYSLGGKSNKLKFHYPKERVIIG